MKNVPIGIDINGLNQNDQDRIREIGLSAWMDETVATKTKTPHAAKPEQSAPVASRQSPRTRRTCQCGRTFLAKRADAQWCSQACRSRASRSRTKNGQGDTDNVFGASVTGHAVNDLATVQNDENACAVVADIPALSVSIPELSVSRSDA